MVRLNLLLEATEKGLRVSAEGDRLVVRGPRRLEPIALELLANKPEVMALLRERPELAELDSIVAKVLHTFGGKMVPSGSDLDRKLAEAIAWTLGSSGRPRPQKRSAEPARRHTSRTLFDERRGGRDA